MSLCGSQQGFQGLFGVSSSPVVLLSVEGEQFCCPTEPPLAARTSWPCCSPWICGSTGRAGMNPSPDTAPCAKVCVQMCWHSWSRCEHCRASCPGPWWLSVPVMPLEPWGNPPQQFWQASRSPACEGTSFPPPHLPCNKIHPPQPPGQSLQLEMARFGSSKAGDK